MGPEKRQTDFECDIHYECRQEAALELLSREFGNKAEFTHEEIEERAQELEEEWLRYQDD